MGLCFNPAVSMHRFDGAQEGESILCEVPSRETGKPNRYLIPAELVALLRQFDGSKAASQIVSDHIRNNPGSQSPEKLTRLIDSFFVPKQLLVSAGAEQLPPKADNRSQYLYARFQLLPAAIVGEISKPLGYLFARPLFIVFALLFVACQVTFFLRVLPAHKISINDLQGFDFLVVTLSMSVLSLLHEIGHAAALAHYGSTNASIGWGLYLMFPVFYTDLSDAWRLPRMQRAIVDLGGIYFSGLTTVVLCAVLLINDEVLLVYCFIGVTMQIASSLNPFLRMDAYWVVADVFGISDLRAQTIRIFRSFLSTILRGRATAGASKTPLAGLSRTATVVLTIYCLLSAGFFLFLWQFMFRQFVFKLLPAYPSVLTAVANVLVERPFNLVRVTDLLIGALWKSFAMVGLVFFLWRQAKRLPHLVRVVSWWLMRPALPLGRNERTIDVRLDSKP